MGIENAGTFKIGGDLAVHRFGCGAMRIVGKGIWGPPDDHDTVIAVLRRLRELGIDFIDTADSYGPYLSEDLIHEALHPEAEAANRHDATTGQVALAWLLARSPVMLPIPGTGSVEHLEENAAAAELELDADELAVIEAAAG